MANTYAISDVLEGLRGKTYKDDNGIEYCTSGIFQVDNKTHVGMTNKKTGVSENFNLNGLDKLNKKIVDDIFDSLCRHKYVCEKEKYMFGPGGFGFGRLKEIKITLDNLTLMHRVGSEK